jgi:hypothetical protein
MSGIYFNTDLNNNNNHDYALGLVTRGSVVG